MRIILIGPMGSGKSSIGKLLSKKMNLKFLDTDKLIENQENIKIKEIFNSKGQDYFRDLEISILKKIIKTPNAVIATGGGIVERKENRLLLKKENNVFFIDSSVKRQFERTKDSDKRPLLNKGNNLKILEELYNKRLKHYENLSNHSIKMDGRANEEIIDFIIQNS